MSPSKYPAAAGYVVNMVMALIVSFNFLTASQAQYVSTIVVALVSVAVAFMVKPFILGAATGAFQSLIVGLSAFALHLTDGQISAVVAIFGLIAAVVTHTLVIPNVAAKAGASSVRELEGKTALA